MIERYKMKAKASESSFCVIESRSFICIFSFTCKQICFRNNCISSIVCSKEEKMSVIACSKEEKMSVIA